MRVHGAGLNRADLVQRAGFYHAPPGSPADIPGLEFAGEVVAHGDGVTEPALGARVFGIAGGGGAGRAARGPRVAVRAGARRARPRRPRAASPRCSSPRTMRSSPRPRCSAGEVLLVHAVGSGVGTAAVQLGRATGCTVVGTARTPEKLEQARALGLDHGGARRPRARPGGAGRRHHRRGRTGRRRARAGGRRLPRHRPRRRRAPRPHRARRDDGAARARRSTSARCS